MKKNISIIVCTFIISSIGLYGIKVAEKHGSYISTNGLSSQIVESDVAKMIVTILNETDSIKEVQSKRQSEKKAILEFLKTQGITDENITHTDSSIEDMLRWSDNTQNKKKYKISDNIYIKSNDVYLIKKISEIISSEFMGEGIIVGVNIRYIYKGLDELRLKMIEDATKDSKNRAERIATVTNKKLDGLRNLHTGKFSIVAEDSSSTQDSDYHEGENSINKRIRLVVQGTFNIR